MRCLGHQEKHCNHSNISQPYMYKQRLMPSRRQLAIFLIQLKQPLCASAVSLATYKWAVQLIESDAAVQLIESDTAQMTLLRT